MDSVDLKFLVDFVHKYFPVTIEQEKIELPPPPTQKAPSVSNYKSDISSSSTSTSSTCSNGDSPFPEVPPLEDVYILLLIIYLFILLY